MNTVRDIFIEVQRSVQTHKLCAKKLASTLSADQENVTYFLKGGVDRILLHPAAGACVDRSVAFIGTFLSTSDDSVLDVSIRHICSRLQSSNKVVRQRVCQIACNTLGALSAAKVDLSDELFLLLSAEMSNRLKDKVPAVRVAALRALKYLQFSEDPEDVGTLAIKRTLRSDTSAAVRVAAVEALNLTDDSRHDLCGRLKDVKSEVRAAVLARLADFDIRQFTTQMRAEILLSALQDREDMVRSAVLQLIWKWLAMVDGGNVPKFLTLLNPVDNEEAATVVGATIMEELIKSENAQHAKMKKALKDCYFKWNSLASSGTASSLLPSDVLWVHIRCSYARQFLPVFPASELCDVLLPDAAVLCTLLKDVKSTLVNPQAHHTKQSSIARAQRVVKYLHSLGPLLIGTTDMSGLSQLMSECIDTFTNTGVTLPWDVVEVALRTYSELHVAAGEAEAHPHRTVLSCSAQLRAQAAQLIASAQEEVEDEAERALSPETAEALSLDITERCLQLTQWALQQEMSIAAGTAACGEGEGEGSAVVQEVLPFILDCLAKPSSQLRLLAVSCLGLICLVDDRHCDTYRGLIRQIAIGDFEESAIRAQALQCLVDFSVVHRDRHMDDADLCNALIRMQDSGEPEAMLVAAEATTKLLHAGAQHEPRLFANLLKFFFLTESLPQAAAPSFAASPRTPSGNEEEDLAALKEEYERRLFLANCARLQQILSVFFHVFTTVDVVADRVVADAIPFLVSDMTSEIKDGTVDASAITKILKHLLSLCESKTENIAAKQPSSATAGGADEAKQGDDEEQSEPAADPVESSQGDQRTVPTPTLLSLARASTAAALSKELLKLGSSKVEKAIDKEFIKLLSTLAFESWIAQYDVAAVERVVDTISVCSVHDRTSVKLLEQLMQVCANPSLHDTSAAPSAVAFAQLAPGLTDLVELAARSSSVLDMSVDEGGSFCVDGEASMNGLSSLPGSAVKPKRAARTPLSAVKAPASAARGVLSTPSRAPPARTVRASRMSYAEQDSDSNSDSGNSDDEDDESSGSESDDGDSTAESDQEESLEEASSARSKVMSPTKHFIGKAKGRATGSGKVAVGVQKASRSRRGSDENVVSN